METKRTHSTLKELPLLFFKTKQLIRAKLPQTHSPNEWMRCEILRYIQSQSPTPTMRDVAAFLRIKAPSVTSIIIHLEREGLVSRVREKNDRRVVRIVLTKKGTMRIHKYEAQASMAMSKVFSKMPAREVEELARILKSLQAAHQA